MKSAIGLLGDLGQTFGVKMQQLYSQPFVTALIQQANKVDDEDIKDTAKWTQSVILFKYTNTIIYIIQFIDHCYDSKRKKSQIEQIQTKTNNTYIF